MKHPEEIYKDINGKEMTNPERLWGEGMGRRHAYDLGHEAGYAKCLDDRSDPLAGYSNLTDAIKSKQPIDWEKLDGLKSKLVNSLGESISHQLSWNTDYDDDRIIGQWWVSGMSVAIDTLLQDSVGGKDGWSLYVEGDIPIRRKTADQLDYYTYFYGHTPGEKPVMAYVGGSESGSGRRVHYAPCMATSLTRASNWVVLEEYGTSPKPEGE